MSNKLYYKGIVNGIPQNHVQAWIKIHGIRTDSNAWDLFSVVVCIPGPTQNGILFQPAVGSTPALLPNY